MRYRKILLRLKLILTINYVKEKNYLNIDSNSVCIFSIISKLILRDTLFYSSPDLRKIIKKLKNEIELGSN